MNHFKISIIKSILRIVSGITGGILAFINIPAAICITAIGFAVAEVLGILEEIFDKRKEE